MKNRHKTGKKIDEFVHICNFSLRYAVLVVGVVVIIFLYTKKKKVECRKKKNIYSRVVH